MVKVLDCYGLSDGLIVLLSVVIRIIIMWRFV